MIIREKRDNTMTKRRVVITGLGAVTPYGVGVNKFWDALKAGKSGISTTESISLERHVVHISGEVKDFNPEEYMDPKEAKKMDRFIQFAVVAADEAVKDAGLDNIAESDIDPYRVGVIVSSAAGGFKTFEDNHVRIIEKGPNKCSPFTMYNGKLYFQNITPIQGDAFGHWTNAPVKIYDVTETSFKAAREWSPFTPEYDASITDPDELQLKHVDYIYTFTRDSVNDEWRIEQC